MAYVLIVDDEEPVRVMLRQMLEREGHEVAEGSCGSQGLTLYRQRPADLVITDILMPQTGGLVAIATLRAEFPDARIIAISGGGRDGRLNFLAAARTFPGVLTLRKPFSRGELLDAVNRLLPAESATLG